MRWSKRTTHRSIYQYTSTNQYGDRYKINGTKAITVATLEADIDDAHDLKTLILLSDHLNVPVRYDFNSKPQRAYIEVVGAENI
jgi:hypothetical protein